MTSPASTLTARRLTAAILGGLALLLISSFIFQPAAAQREPTRLKPPFKLIQPAQMPEPLSGVPPLPLNAPIVMSETFDSAFTLNVRYNFNVNNPNAPWHLVNASGLADTGYTWGRVAGLPITDTLWNVATNPPGMDPIAAGQPYTRNMQSYAIYGPVDMTDFTSAYISMTYGMDTLNGDLFGVAYSTNGTDFTWVAATSGRDPGLATRRTDYYPLPASLTRQNQVWIALVFTSQNHATIDALGVYVEDVVLRAQPAYKIYLPVMRFDPTPTPTVTPTPTITPTPANVYLYNYTFGTGTSTSDQNFVDWGKKVSTADCFFGTNGTACGWGQDLQTGGNPDGALMVYQNGLYSWAGASPNTVAPTDFEYSADIFVVQPKKNARFGLIFNASSGAFGRNGDGVPFFDPNRNFYKFDLQFNETDASIISYYRLEACLTEIEQCNQPIGKSNIPSGYVNNVGGWNNIRVQRLGTNLKIYLNNNLLINISTSTHIGSGKFGVFLQSKDFNNITTPLKVKIDNIRIKTLP